MSEKPIVQPNVQPNIQPNQHPIVQPMVPAAQALGGNINRTVEPEQMLWEGGFSIRAMAGWYVLLLIVTIAAAVAIFFTPWRDNFLTWAIAGGVLGVAWLYLLIASFYRKFLHHYQLSTQRLRHRDGIMMRRMDRIELIHIDDVVYRQGPINILLDVGDITVKSTDPSHPYLHMWGIANVKKVADMIDDARRAERIKRAIHMEKI